MVAEGTKRPPAATRPVPVQAEQARSTRNKKPARGGLFVEDLVGETGFEPAAFSSRTRRATWLRYTPMSKILLHSIFGCKPL